MSTRSTTSSITGARRQGADAARAFAACGPAGLRLSRRHLLQVTGLGAAGLELSRSGIASTDAQPIDADVTPLDGGDLNHYTGQFHSHTGVSSDHPTTRGEPMDAWKHVAEVSDLDFFAVTEHDVTYDVRNADIETEDWRDAVSQEWRLLHEQAEEFNQDVETTGLIAVPGTEHTWYDFSGHSNTFNTNWLATAQSGGDHKAAGLWGIGHLCSTCRCSTPAWPGTPGRWASSTTPIPTAEATSSTSSTSPRKPTRG